MANSISPSILSSSTTIHDLPQHTLIHILTFLYIQDAIRSSLVSRSFRDLWHLLPTLHLDIFEFYSRSTSPAPRSNHSRHLFVDFVSQTLMFRQPNPFTKLHLAFEYANFGAHKYHVRSWIRYAVNLRVSELVIDFRDEELFDEWDDPDTDKRLSLFDFNVLEIGKSRVKALKLYNCDISLPPLTNPIKFVFLKSLRLEGTQPLLRGDVCYLLARCVNLEILTFVKISFDTEEGLVIHSSSLRELYLNLCMNCKVDLALDLYICCPSLQKISLDDSELGKVINKDTTRLVEACINFQPFFLDEEYDESWEKMLSYFTNITSIDEWADLLESNEVPAGCERFASNVKHLELPCDYSEIDLVGVAALLKLMPKLEILGLENRWPRDGYLGSDYSVASTVFNIPCLKKLIIRRYHKTKSEEHFINLFKKNGIVLDKIELLK